MVRPKDPKRQGNNKPDQKFIAEELATGRLKVVEPSPDDPPFQARYQWTGRAEDIGSLWQIPSDEKRCTGLAYVRDEDGVWIKDAEGVRLQRPCNNWANMGSKICTPHGGGVPVVRAAALSRMIAAADAVTGALVQIGLDPNQDGRVRVAAINSLLDRAGLKAHSSLDVAVSVKPYETLLEHWSQNGVLEEPEGDDAKDS